MATGDVKALIDQQTIAVNSWFARADTYLKQLVDIANVQFSDAFNIDTLLPNEYNYASVPQVYFPIFGASGSVGAISITAPPSVPNPLITSYTAVSVPDFLSSDLIAPTTQFEFYEAAYSSTLLDPLKVKLLDNLTNGGYGIETADEVALFNRARDREIELAMTRIDDAGRAMAIRGFPLPPGELSIYVDKAWQDMQNKVSGASRDITLERAKLYVENRQFTIKEVKDVEQILIGFHNSVQERALNASKAAVEVGIAIYNTQLARFKMWLDTAKVTSDVQSAQLQVQVEQAKTYFDGFRAQIAAYEADVKGQVETQRLKLDSYKADIDNMRMLNEGRSALAGLQQKVIEATVQQNIQISNLAIENAKAKLLATVEALKFKTASVQYGSAQFFALLTAMVNTINTLATQSETTTT